MTQRAKNMIFRDLNNYKSMHRRTAEEKGVLSALMNAPTLTAARKILFGSKQKSFRCCKDICYQCAKGKR